MTFCCGFGIAKSMIIVVPGEARCRAAVKVFAGDGAHKRQLHVRMRIDAARHHVLATRIDNCCAFRSIKALANRCDDTVLAKYVRPNGSFGIDNSAALDKYRHDELPISPRATK